MTTHPSATPDISSLIAAIEKHGVRYVITGSVAGQLYGADISQPGDMDITPALDHENLCHLSAVLLEMEAGIDGSLGQWETNSDGESKIRRAIRLDVCGYLC